MEKYDLHVHSNFSDGKDSIEDIVLSAIDMGIKKLGISDHSYTSFDESYCIKKQAVPSYISQINELKVKYKDKIEVLCGIEQDFYSEESCDNFDYVIGSVHYVKVDDEYIPVDENADIIKKAVDKYFDGDYYSYAELYFDTVSQVVDKTNCDIIGHFDLITKFNDKEKLFDTSNPRYIIAYMNAVDKLVKHKKLFEINTGAISRGYKEDAYPSADIIEYIKSKQGLLILSSDSHSKNTLCFKFEEYSNLI